MHARTSALLAFGFATMATAPAHAFDIDGTPPQVHFNGITNSKFPGLKSYFEDKMNAEVAAAFNGSIDSARAKLKGYQSQKKLAQGMANANAYSANAATLQGYPNYSLFAVSSGAMFGFQLPSLDIGELQDVGDDIKEKGDIYAGLGMGFSFVNIGINCGKFLLPGLYLNAKYGGLKYDFGDYALDYKVMGLGASYTLLAPKSLIGLVKWRGISASTGFYMQMDKLNVKVEPDSIRTDAKFRNAVLSGATSAQDSTDKEAILTEMGYGPGSKDAQVVISPVFDMGLDISTYTIPLELNTAVALLWGVINVNAGAGVDLNFGSADITLKGESDANIHGNSDKVTFDPATVNVSGSASNGPAFVRPRIMTGVGLGLGPVKIDVPLVYYFNSGLALGVTAAVVW